MIKTFTTSHNRHETETALIHASEVVEKKILLRLDEKGNGLFVDKHQIYGIVAEEVKELMDALHGNDIEGMKRELKDIAVAAIWGIASIEESEA